MTGWLNRRDALKSLGLLVVGLAGCQYDARGENPEGYPPIVDGRGPAPAPTQGGGFAPGGANGPGGVQAGAAALGPGAANPGVYEAMNGPGSATTSPTPNPTPTPQPGATVRITADRGFDPFDLTIQRGGAVLWRNESRSPHTVTCDPAMVFDRRAVVLPAGAMPFSLGPINPGESVVRRFDVAGEYRYVTLTLERRGIGGRIVVTG